MLRADDMNIPGDVNSLRDRILKNDYSEEFDSIRKAMVITSHYKYGAAKNNFGDLGGVDAIETLKMCLEKFEQTHNTEYLADVANYAMFRFMFPKQGEFYKATDSNGSAGVSGITQKEMEKLRTNSWV